MSINSLSSSSTVLTVYLRTHINTLNSHFATLVNIYHYHILTQISQSWAKHAFYVIFSIMLAIFAYYAGIMLNVFTTLLCWHNRLKPTNGYY